MNVARICLTTLILTPSLTACGDDPVAATDSADTAEVADVAEVETIDPNAFCESTTTTFEWDPVAATALNAFPDDSLTRDDAEAITGMRVQIGEPAWLASESTFFQPVWRQLEELDGFGTSAGIVLRFSAAIEAPPGTVVDSVINETIELWDLGKNNLPAQRVPYTAELLEEGKTLILTPVRPLRESQLHAVLVTKDHKARDGGCIAPSPTLKALLLDQASDDKVSRLKVRKDFFLSQTGREAHEVSALSLFTTQTIFARTLTQRLELRAKTYDWRTEPVCTVSGNLKKCRGVMTAWDYRIEGYLGEPKEPVTYELPVHIWLKVGQTQPASILFFGHGLGGEASQSRPIAEIAAAANMATVAISAPRHGDHPTATPGSDSFIDLFGISIADMTIDGFVFRENLRQASFDKQQVLELLSAQPDIDGDDTPDVNASRVVYWGISLGGIMGADFVGQTERVDAGIFSIAGGRLISVATDSKNFQGFAELLATMVGGPDALKRLASPAQTLIDAGDPVNWASRLVKDRFDAGRPPHILMQMVMDDETVPNVSTEALARAIEIPQVPTLISAIDPLRAEAKAPVSANVVGRTGGLFQFDRVTISGVSQDATHNNIFSGSEALTQIDTFLKSWSFDVNASPVIMDPYAR
jgi:hypothetical protein